MSVRRNLQASLRAFRAGRLLVIIVMVVWCAGYWAYSAADNALHYTKTSAMVENVEPACEIHGERAASIAECMRTVSRKGRKGVVIFPEVRVRYQSPADNREHSGTIRLSGRDGLARAERLNRGDRLEILAHDDKPEDIKEN